MSKYKENDVVNVVVTGIEKYGVFVKIDKEYNGLIHISEISHNYVKNIFDFVNLGEEIKAKIISIDEDTKQMKMSIKDIEYKIIDETKIKETPNGFNTLKEKLDDWVKEKKEELMQYDNK